jgi:DNA helicase II / ATP-dependent DNA helicase PcrA
VIDEAQDFSPMQIAILKAFCPSQAFTILGDLSQSIHAYQGITQWDAFLSLFPEEARQYYQLDISYRSTTEIIEFANHVVSHFPGYGRAQPVFRSGDPVLVEPVEASARLETAVQRTQQLAVEANTLAVVTRSEAEALLYHDALQKAGVSAHLITAAKQSYEGGISVLPAYLTKGLEFDAVLIVDVTAKNYDATPESAKLLYVGCTRALHQLCLQYSGEPSPLLATP